MAKTALYQKYRSTTFDEVVGQEYIVKSIKNAVREGKVSHAYLFCGPRGTGKTTMARILAKAVNCEHPEIAPCDQCENCIAANNGTHPDIIEINAANETHVEDIRDLIDKSRLSPMQGKHKVYIIDEVHQLSSAASSALLKTLEEPPENVIFILATTDPQKLLPTIISRCQRYDFTKIAIPKIVNHLLDIAQKESIAMEPEAAEMIAVLSDGGMRDALSIMDQCAAYTEDNITVDAVNSIYGLATTQEKVDLLKDIFNQDVESLVNRMHAYEQKGIDLLRFCDGMQDILKDLLIYSNIKKENSLKYLKKEQADELLQLTTSGQCLRMAQKILEQRSYFRTASSAASCFEIICLGLLEDDAPEQTVTKKKAQPKPQQKEEFVSRETIEVNKEEPAPVQTEVKSAEKASVPEPTPIVSIPSYSPEQIVSLLVQCDKQSRSMDEQKLSEMVNSFDMDAMKYISLIREVKLVASGKDCMVVLSDQNSVVDALNDPQTNKEVYSYCKDKYAIDKKLFAITQEQYKDALALFRKMRAENNLPQPMKIDKYSDTAKEKTSEEKVIDLFGKDNVEII